MHNVTNKQPLRVSKTSKLLLIVFHKLQKLVNHFGTQDYKIILRLFPWSPWTMIKTESCIITWLTYMRMLFIIQPFYVHCPGSEMDMMLEVVLSLCWIAQLLMQFSCLAVTTLTTKKFLLQKQGYQHTFQNVIASMIAPSCIYRRPQGDVAELWVLAVIYRIHTWDLKQKFVPARETTVIHPHMCQLAEWSLW